MFRTRRSARAVEVIPDEGFVDIGVEGPMSTLGRLVLSVWVFSVVAILGVGALHTIVLRNELAAHEVSRALVTVEDRVAIAIQPAVTPELLAGDPAAYAEFDRIIRDYIVHPDTASLLLWDAQGTVVYSLDPVFAGQQFPLSESATEVLRTGESIARHDELDGPGDRTSATSSGDDAIEVYTRLVGPGGEQMVWEVELFRESVSRQASRLVVIVAILEGFGAVVLLTTQGVMARSLVRRHDRERAYRRWLTQRTSEVALVERRRMAADLHDGVVQDLTGIALDLEVPDGEASSRAELAARVRDAVGSLRVQTAELYPAASARIDVSTSLQGMLDRLPDTFEKDLIVQYDAEVPPGYRWLVFRVAQEAIRNAGHHSRGSRVTVQLLRSGHGTVLTVEDDGVGFSPLTDSAAPGHMGLTLLADMALAAGCSLSVRSAPGAGTTVKLEVPQ
jgi:two-component system, NarL family, sensor kinase